MSDCCKEFSRSRLLRHAAEAGKGLPAIEPGCRCRPGPASTGARSSPAPLGLALAGLRSRVDEPAALEDGILPRRRRPRRPRRFWSRSSWTAASTRSRCSRPSVTPITAAAAEARAPDSPCGSAATTACAGTRRAAVQDAARRGQAHAHPGRWLPRRGPVALHVAPLLGGRDDEPRRGHRMAGPLPRPGRIARQPAPGALARRGACAVVGHGARPSRR